MELNSTIPLAIAAAFLAEIHKRHVASAQGVRGEMVAFYDAPSDLWTPGYDQFGISCWQNKVTRELCYFDTPPRQPPVLPPPALAGDPYYPHLPISRPFQHAARPPADRFPPWELGNGVLSQNPALNPYYPHLPKRRSFQHAARPPADRFPPWELGNEVPFQTPTLNPYYPHLPISHPFQHAARPPADRFPPWELGSEVPFQTPALNPYYPHLPMSRPFQHAARPPADRFPPWIHKRHVASAQGVRGEMVAFYDAPSDLWTPGYDQFGISCWQNKVTRELCYFDTPPRQPPVLPPPALAGDPYYPHLPISRPFQHAARPPADRFPPWELGNGVLSQNPALNPYYPHLPKRRSFQHAARPPADRFPPWELGNEVPFQTPTLNPYYPHLPISHPFQHAARPPADRFPPWELGSEVPFQTPALNPYYPHLPMSRPFQHAARPPADRFPPWIHKRHVASAQGVRGEMAAFYDAPSDLWTPGYDQFGISCWQNKVTRELCYFGTPPRQPPVLPPPALAGDPYYPHLPTSRNFQHAARPPADRFPPWELGNEVPFQNPALNPYYPHLPTGRPFQHAARPPADRFPPWELGNEVPFQTPTPNPYYPHLPISHPFQHAARPPADRFPPWELGSEVPFQTPALNPYYPHLPMSRPFQHAARPPADRFPPWEFGKKVRFQTPALNVPEPRAAKGWAAPAVIEARPAPPFPPNNFARSPPPSWPWVPLS